MICLSELIFRLVDAEGRLVLADALYYVTSTYKPSTVIDAATVSPECPQLHSRRRRPSFVLP